MGVKDKHESISYGWKAPRTKGHRGKNIIQRTTVYSRDIEGFGS